MLVTNTDELVQLVRHYRRQEAFVFDLETRYVASEDEEARHVALRAMSPDKRSAVERAWLEEFELRATDERRNEVIWFGLATWGRSDAIACGHPNGEVDRPAGTYTISVQEAYPEGHPRRKTRSGKESRATVKRSMPATFHPPPPQVDIVDACEILEPLLFGDARKINQNLAFDVRTIAKYYGGELLPGPWGELQVALHLLDETAFNAWDLETFVGQRLGHRYNKLAKKGGVTLFSFLDAARYAEQDARFTWLLWVQAERRLRAAGLWDLFCWEMEVAEALRPQEMHGIKVDRDMLVGLQWKHEEKAKLILHKLIVDHGAPHDFNPNANAQKATLLYDHLGAISERRTRVTGNRSVAHDVLEEIALEKTKAAPAAKLLIEYAENAKLIGTYFIGVGSKLTERDYIHPSFSQHRTRTGRLSGFAPNPQNIPRQSEVRGMFVADDGEVLISVDYDQIELRFICMFSGDETMRDLFLGEHDIHTATAALVTGLPPEKINGELRTVAGKNPNFLIGYGGGAYRLHMMTGQDVERCQEIIDRYYKQFRRLQPWKQREIALAKSRAGWINDRGHRHLDKRQPPWVETMMGRRRRLPDLFINPRRAGDDREEYRRLRRRLVEAERQAINTIVQGSAAETLKLAMIDINNHLRLSGFPLDVVLNVHDELVAVCPEDCAEEGMKMLVHKMENVINPFTGNPPLENWVPLIASGKISDRWSKG